MNDVNQLSNTPFDDNLEEKKLPGSLNTLTILTFIGSGLSLLFSLMGFVNGRKSIDDMEKLQGSSDYDKMPDFAKKFVGPDALEMARIAYENRIPLLIIGLVTVALCVYGAMQMRARLKQGYFIYVIGEILPIISGLIFLGTASLSGIYILGPIIAILFIILYGTQLKYLR